VLKIFKMEEEKENKTMLIGLDMVELIMRVQKKFKEEYGFKPKLIEVTNVIAKRVNDNDLF